MNEEERGRADKETREGPREEAVSQKAAGTPKAQEGEEPTLLPLSSRSWEPGYLCMWLFIFWLESLTCNYLPFSCSRKTYFKINKRKEIKSIKELK